MRNADGEGVEHSPSKSHVRSHIAHADTHDAVVAHLDGQRDKYHGESDGLFAHAKHRSEEAEENHHRGDNQAVGALAVACFFAPLDAPKEGHYSYIDGVAIVQYPKSTAHHKDEDNDVGLVDKPVEEGRKHLPSLRGGVDIMEGIRDYHLSPLYHLAGELARWHYPRQHCGQNDKGKDDGKRMRYALHINDVGMPFQTHPHRYLLRGAGETFFSLLAY